MEIFYKHRICLLKKICSWLNFTLENSPFKFMQNAGKQPLVISFPGLWLRSLGPVGSEHKMKTIM